MMAILAPHQVPMPPAFKRQRRTATSVLAGDFDLRPARDVLTSLLNGVGPYKDVEKDEETRRIKKKERKERDKEKRRASTNGKAPEKPSWTLLDPPAAPVPSAPAQSAAPVMQTSSFWRAQGTLNRPTIHIATMQRSLSITPPPMPSSPQSTPGPSTSSTTSRTSSKRPRTPDEYDFDTPAVESSPPPQPVPKKKRVAVKKGWKGWVEGSPPPSEKLINLDAVPVLQERRTRSGKSFDAIGVGKDGWV
ncbi:hypothetical protein BV22DRAFT_1034392 [Leucogyrophana mollusca]|uniref:Uncharacterized protein n=1 Tax=Leucogyrophana mollusca TaxID=85980 RepID=A0ACB8BJS4_9AGAM|nr:hypothetical protein BV22DRAFT_1034392 [Leucogyrophana mollusca]